MTRWGIVIDLRKCVGCGTCIMACKVNNHLPKGIFLARLMDYEDGEYPNVKRKFLIVQCMHCEEPACIEVCPTGATHIKNGGIVSIDEHKCIGCKSCIMSCPYGARSYIKRIGLYYGDEKTAFDELISKDWRTGTIAKCSFCSERVENGLKRGLKPGVDPDATPICVVSCITGARYFGDLDDPESEVSRLIKSSNAIQIHPELGTKPKIYYLR